MLLENMFFRTCQPRTLSSKSLQVDVFKNLKWIHNYSLSALLTEQYLQLGL